MRQLLQSLIISIAVIAIALPCFAGNDREGEKWDRDKKEQRHHNIHSGKQFKKLILMLEALDERVTELEGENTELKARLACISGESDAYNVFFNGCNVHVRNGVGSTESKNEMGNLIVGYNEDNQGGTNDRTGSHNLVVGTEHAYSGSGGFVAGSENTVSGIFASVSGGAANTASGRWSSISGGHRGEASGIISSVSGGVSNSATHIYATVSGGTANHASGPRSHISGGNNNVAEGEYSNISGGSNNIANGIRSSIGGGSNIACFVDSAWAAGTTADTCP